MAVFFGSRELEERIDPGFALRAMETAFDLEADGLTRVVTRLDVPSSAGFLRVMPAILDDVMGLKVMTLVRGLGTRYLVLLHAADTGELLAVFDADELTRWRTAATTALAARHLVAEAPTELGLVGSGFEAVGELRALASLWALERVHVFSPTEARRRAFCSRMSDELGIAVVPVAAPVAAVSGRTVVVLATKSETPVLDGAAVDPGAVVLSIGSTRPDLRELDRRTFARTGTLVGDDPNQLLAECGDVAEALASGAITADRMVSLADVRAGRAQVVQAPGRDLVVFKSAGTALQDLALAQAVYWDGRTAGYGVDLGELASLKPFAAPAERSEVG